MLSLSRKADYALVALAGLAADRGSGASARDLADRLHLPLPALRNILKRLTQQGLLASTQGPRGGYRLARRPGEITIAQLVEAIDGPARITMCCPADPAADRPRCHLEPSCRIKEAVRHLNSGLVEFLESVTLADIVDGSVLAPKIAIADIVPAPRPAGEGGGLGQFV